jgi:hypothetical protein
VLSYRRVSSHSPLPQLEHGPHELQRRVGSGVSHTGCSIPLSIKTEDICLLSAPLASYTTLPARRGCCTSPRRYPSIQPAPRIPNGEAQAWHVSLVPRVSLNSRRSEKKAGVLTKRNFFVLQRHTPALFTLGADQPSPNARSQQG